MDETPLTLPLDPATDVLIGGGECGAVMRAVDWAGTGLGPVAAWPEGIKAAVSICLASRFPMIVFAGRDLAMLYNDGYRPVLGPKHPASMGRPCRDVWPEIWHIVGPELEDALAGNPNWVVDRLLPLERYGYLEECRFTSSFSPIRLSDGSIGGVFCAVNETTERYIGERRVATLRDLAAEAAGATEVEETFRRALVTLSRNPSDVPFALGYRIAEDGRSARLVATAGLEPGDPAGPPLVALSSAEDRAGWDLGAVAAGGRTAVVETALVEKAGRFDALPAGDWPTRPPAALVMPLTPPGHERPIGLLVLGVSGRKALDDDYRGFFDLLCGHVTSAIAHAQAYEEQRRRAEALAEIDRAKTAFFSNVSHEFRTPLTLMMGPVEETLADPALPPAARDRLAVAHRNSLRLLRLVNTLLDFSRIEAGRVQASYAPTDLAALTAELASNFRSVCGQAGLELRVDCPALPEPVFVDRDMWEKIVLNLLSNAFKFTFAGGIAVSLAARGGTAELRVRDTGIGIPEAELPRLFERFHRVEGARGRTHEGTGIGLALVQELASLHGGAVTVTSAVGQGTEILVRIPLGSAHLPRERVGAEPSRTPTVIAADAFVEEALRWLPGGRPAAEPPSEPSGPLPRVLVADDNADMLDYVARLLEPRYAVTRAADGEAALAAARAEPPDLILSDVMMPRLDGVGLLRAVRADPRLAPVPVILLSARAGEEASVGGMAAGADDYLTKPFAARELLARVESNLALTRRRRDAEERERALRAEAERERERVTMALDAARMLAWDWDLRSGAATRAGTLDRVLGLDASPPEVFFARVHPDDRARVEAATARALAGAPYREEYRLLTAEGGVIWVQDRAELFRDAEGRPVRMAGVTLDITERREAEERQGLLLAELNHRVKNTLATVQSIAMMSLGRGRDPHAFMEAFGARLSALSRAHDLLTGNAWAGVGLAEVAGLTLAPFADEGRVSVRGPAVQLNPNAAVSLNMALHELATNATKYGALSVPDGRVSVSWSLDGGEGYEVDLVWQETGGPPVTAPAAKGFGSRLIERGLPRELGGAVTLAFDPAGVVCRMRFPLSHKIMAA